jgi:hypothetical protein
MSNAMNPRLAATLTALALAVAPAAARADEAPTARQLVQRMVENRQLDGSESVSTLTIFNARGQKRVRKLATVTRLDADRSRERKLLRFLAPAEVRGTSVLSHDHARRDDEMWIYLPSLRKTRRIVAAQQSKSFMGSEFSYADMNLPNLDDFRYRKLGTEPVAGTPCWIVEITPRDSATAETYGYSRRVAWIGKTDSVARRVRYHDLEGQLERELTTSRIVLVDPKKRRHRALSLQMVNRNNGRRSTLVVHRIELSRDVPERTFSIRYLERR